MLDTQEEKRITDALTWCAIYNGGESLWECNSRGVRTATYEDIERERLIEFRVVTTTDRMMSNDKTFVGVNLLDIKLSVQRMVEEKIFRDDFSMDNFLKERQAIFHSVNGRMAYYWVPPGAEVELAQFGFKVMDLRPKLKINIRPGYRLIWRKRRHQAAMAKQPFMTVYLAGWQVTIDERNIQSIVYLYPDGTIELGGDRGDEELHDYEK